MWLLHNTGRFRVQLANNHLVLAYVANRAKRELRRLRVGEHLRLEMSPYDPDRARITARLADSR